MTYSRSLLFLLLAALIVSGGVVAVSAQPDPPSAPSPFATPVATPGGDLPGDADPDH